MEEVKINKDLILREKLAIERTVMANQRTFLSFLRTALYFSIAGLSINELLNFKNENVVVAVSFAISFFLLVTGIFTYWNQKKKIKNSRKQLGGKVNIEED